MAKPIFVIAFPYNADPVGVQQAYSDLVDKLHDYHVLTYRTRDVTGIDIEVYNAVDATDTEIADLIAKTREEVMSLMLAASAASVGSNMDQILNPDGQADRLDEKADRTDL